MNTKGTRVLCKKSITLFETWKWGKWKYNIIILRDIDMYVKKELKTNENNI